MLRIKYLLSFTLLLWISSATAQKLKLVGSNNNRVNYMGRVLQTDSCTTFYWCGTSVQLNVKNTENVKAIFSENADVNYYDVIIDGKYTSKLKVLKGKHTYTVANGLTKKPHTIQLFKATNTDEKITNFYGFMVDECAKVLKDKTKQPLKMEFFGDSITAGHGVEVPDGMEDTYFAEYFNNYFTYAAITARYFNAQYHNTSKSGIGVTVSWDPAIMPEIYNRLNPNDSLSKWDFSKYQPDIVVVNLFQNDNSLVNKPEHVQFIKRFGTTKPSEEFIINAYKNFISSLRSVYPNAKIICALGNMDAVNKDSKWPGYIKTAVKELNDNKLYVNIFKPKNSPGHPRMAAQQAMADSLIKFIKDNKLDQ
ncbi:electron transporter RnfD [Pedobacter changchengzhani]|uniref:Electron transporter RnfD n=1 Tax=Pedobacter changchengzhani TaxID=2529274 RepID=A0A4R5MPL3_9SPHI|nr:SGNH/GDSL hydrolase family protein [Pedobacter changchengzhani]TDG37275.1 electron transporter RnfD [Pedobacter changchengzhani]